MDLYQTGDKKFVAGLLVEGGVVKKAAPIIKWMVGKRIEDVEKQAKQSHWFFIKVV
jgi:hypothetical protein